MLILGMWHIRKEAQLRVWSLFLSSKKDEGPIKKKHRLELVMN